MPNLLSLPTELITLIGSFLKAGVIGLLRLVNKELHTKTWRSFCLRFKTVKVSLIRISIQALSDAALSPDIAKEIKHMIIGTETLEQYEHAPTSYPRALRAMIATEGKAVDLRIWLQNLIVQKLPNLRTITLEDRPEDPDSEYYRPSMGSVELLRRAGVDMSLNGPYGLSIWDNPRQGDDRSFPLVSRLLVFATVFSMLRYLDTRSMVMDFRIVIRGHRVRGQEESDIREAFDITDRCTREVLDAHLTQITVGEDESRYLVTDGFLSFVQGLRDYALGKGILLIERSVDGRFA